MGPEKRKYKYRVVFQGNRVINQNYDAAIFQDLGSSPATLEASRAVDAFGSRQGSAIDVVDAEQAYVQAEMKGTPTWVCLPPEQRTGKAATMRQPVFRLKKALYGHADSGGYWERQCDSGLRKAGFVPVNNWPSMYHHGKLDWTLMVYVDDFKMAGPEQT